MASGFKKIVVHSVWLGILCFVMGGVTQSHAQPNEKEQKLVDMARTRAQEWCNKTASNESDAKSMQPWEKDNPKCRCLNKTFETLADVCLKMTDASDEHCPELLKNSKAALAIRSDGMSQRCVNGGMKDTDGQCYCQCPDDKPNIYCVKVRL